jgi:hypothetical protein
MPNAECFGAFYELLTHNNMGDAIRVFAGTARSLDLGTQNQAEQPVDST